MKDNNNISTGTDPEKPSTLEVLNPFNSERAIIKPNVTTDTGSFSDSASYSPVSAKEYAKYFPSGVSELPNIQKQKAVNQRFYSQAFNWGVQATGEVLGGSISGLGSIYEGLKYAVSDYERQNADFTNLMMELGEHITNTSKEIAPIHRINPNRAFDLKDFGWWAENGVSIASTLSMLVPARAAVGTARWLGKVAKVTDKVGDTTKFLGEAALGAVVMRNAENMRESMTVAANAKKDMSERLANMSETEYKEYLETDIGREWLKETNGSGGKADLANYVAAKAGWVTYDTNSINIVFDFIQTATALRALSGATRTGKAAGTAVAKEQAKAVGKSLTKAQRFGLMAKPGISAFSAQLTEGVEEIINFIGTKEGEAFVKEQKGEDIGDLGTRIGKYLEDPHAWNAGLWGIVGGVAFSKALGIIEGKNLKAQEQKKIAEIGNRANLVKKTMKALSSLETAKKAKVIDDTTYESKKRVLVNTLGYQMGISASMSGNMDLLEAQLSTPEYQEQLEASLTEVEKTALGKNGVQNLAANLVQKARTAESIYNKYNNRVIKPGVNKEAVARLRALQIDAELNLATQQEELTLARQETEKYMPTMDITNSNFREAVQLKANKEALKILESSLLTEDFNEKATASIVKQIELLKENNETLKATLEAGNKGLSNRLEAVEPTKELLEKSVDVVLREALVAQLSDSIMELESEGKVNEIEKALKAEKAKKKAEQLKVFKATLEDESLTSGKVESLINELEELDPNFKEKKTALTKKLTQLKAKEALVAAKNAKEKANEKARLETNTPEEVINEPKVTVKAEFKDFAKDTLEYKVLLSGLFYRDIYDKTASPLIIQDLIAKRRAAKVMDKHIARGIAEGKNSDTIGGELTAKGYSVGSTTVGVGNARYIEAFRNGKIGTLESIFFKVNKESTTVISEKQKEITVEALNEAVGAVKTQQVLSTIENITYGLKTAPQLLPAELRKVSKKARKALGDLAADYMLQEADKLDPNIVEETEEVIADKVNDSTEISVVPDPIVSDTTTQETSKKENKEQVKKPTDENVETEEIETTVETEVLPEPSVEAIVYGSANLFIQPLAEGLSEIENSNYTVNTKGKDAYETIATLEEGSTVTLEVDSKNKYHKANKEDSAIVIKKAGVVIGMLNTLSGLENQLKEVNNEATVKLLISNFKATARLRELVWNNGNPISLDTKVTKTTSGTLIKSENYQTIDKVLKPGYELYYADNNPSIDGLVDELISFTGKDSYVRKGTNNYHNEDLLYTPGAFYALISGINDNSKFTTKEDVAKKVPLRLRVGFLGKKQQNMLYKHIIEVVKLLREENVDFNKNERLNELREAIGNITYFNKTNVNKDTTVPKPYFKIHKEYIEFLAFGGTKLIRIYYKNNTTKETTLVVHSFDSEKGSYNNFKEFNKMLGKAEAYYTFNKKEGAQARDVLVNALSTKQHQISLAKIKSGELTAEQLIADKKLEVDAAKVIDNKGNIVSNFVHKQARDGSSNLVISISADVDVKTSPVKEEVTEVVKDNDTIDLLDNVDKIRGFGKSEPIKESGTDELSELKKFRKARKNKTNKNYDGLTMEVVGEPNTKVVVSTKERIENWKSMFGDNVPFDPNVDGIIRYKGKFAYGLFSQAAVQLSKFAPAGAEAHEAFHVAMHIYLNEASRDKIYAEGRAKYGNLTETEIEEKLAEDFRDYYLSKKKKQSGITAKFFTRLRNFIERILGKYSINRLFNEIDNGYFNYQPDAKSLEYARKIGMTMEASLEDVYGAADLEQYINFIVGVTNTWLGEHPNVTLKDRKNNNDLNVRLVVQDQLYLHLDKLLDAAENSEDRETLTRYIQAGKVVKALAIELDTPQSELWGEVQETVERLLNIKIESEVEFEGNNKLNKDWDDRLAYATSSKESFDFDLKRIIMSTKSVKDYGLVGDKLMYTFKTENTALLPTYINFDYVYNHLASQMANARTIEEMMARLANLGTADPSFLLLWETINSNPLYKAKWYSNFNKTFIEATHHRVLAKDDGFQVTKSISNKRYGLADTWLANINALILENNNTGNSYFNQEFKVKVAKSVLEIRNLLRENKEKNRSEIATALAELSNLFGITLSDNTINKIGTNQAIVGEGTWESTINDKVYLPLVYISKGITDTIGTDNPITFESRGRLNSLGEVASFFEFDATENSYFGVDGNMRFSLSKPSFITDWFDDINQLLNKFTVNKNTAKTRVFRKFQTYAKDPSFKASNWLWTTKDSPGIFKVSNTYDVNKLTEKDLNLDYLANFKFTKDDGLKSVNKRLGAGYEGQSVQDWNISNLLKYLTNNDNKLATYPILVQSDSGNMWNVTSSRISIYNKGKAVVTNDSIDTSSELYQALFNTINQELLRMKQARDLLFITDPETQELSVNPNAPMEALQIRYHYQKLDDNGVPILLDKEGKPTGNVFKFHNMTYESTDGTLQTLNERNLRYKGLYREESHNAETNQIIDKFIKEFVKSQKIQGKRNYAAYESTLKNSTDNFGNSILGTYSKSEDMTAYDLFVTEFMLNTYLTYVEHNNFFNGVISEHKNNKDTNKRAKQQTSPRQVVGTEFRGAVYKGMTLVDVNISSSFYEEMVDNVAAQLIATNNYSVTDYNKTKLKSRTLYKNATPLEKDIHFITSGYLNINRGDAQSYVTIQRYKKIMQDYGRWNEVMETAYAKIEDGKELNKSELKGFLQVLKPFYYDRVFDTRLNKMRSRQIKNSVLPLLPQLIKNTAMEKVLDAATEIGVEEIYFESATKVGMGYANTITNSEGNLKENFKDGLVSDSYFNANWGLQLDVPSHLKDEQNKLGVQISKILIANLNTSAIYKLGDKTMTGEELKSEYFDLLSANIETSARALLDRIGAKEIDGTWTIEDLTKIQEVLIKELKDRGLSKNYIEALEFVTDSLTGEKQFNLPLFVSNMSNKFESILTSLFTNNVTNQKFPGGHVTLASDALITEYLSDDIGINLLDSVKERVTEGKFRLNPPRLVDDNVIEAEALLPAWSKSFFDNNGERVDINNLPEELLTMLGYRIPTEAKYSVVVIKVVGFLPEGHDSTIVLPYELVTQTGWDFDVDSLYLMQKSFKGSVEKGFETINYDEAITAETANNFHVAKLSGNIDNYLALNEEIQAAYKAIEASWKNQTGRLKSLISSETSLTNTTLSDIYEAREALKDYLKVAEENLTELELLQNSYLDEDVNKLFNSLFGATDEVQNLEQDIADVRTEIEDAKITLGIYNDVLSDSSVIDRISKRKSRNQELKAKLAEKLAERKAKIKEWAAPFDSRMLNTTEARNNKIFDVYMSIMTNKYHYIETINPGKFTDPLNLKKRQEFLTGIKVDEINPNTRDGQDFFRATNIAGRALKGLAANSNSLLPILQDVKAEFKVPFKIKVETTEIQVENNVDILETLPQYKIWEALKGIKINTKSAKEETGFTVGTKSDINPTWVSNTSNNTVETLAEDISSQYPELSESLVRDTIIEILGHTPNNYLTKLKAEIRQEAKNLNQTIKEFKKLAHNEDGTYTNMNGDVTTDHAAQMLAMILDIVKEGLPYNINTYTFDTFISMVSTGIDINYAGMFIRQPIINTLAEFKLNSDGILANSTTRPIEHVRRDYQTRLYRLMVEEGLISEKDAVRRGLAVQSGDSIYFKKDTTIFLTHENENLANKASNVLGFDSRKFDAWSIKELEAGLAATNIKNPKDVKSEGYLSWIDMTNQDKIEYLKNQLKILEAFGVYKKNGDAFSAIGKVLNTDKLGAGPSLSVTNRWYENYEIAQGVNPFTGQQGDALIVVGNKPAVDIVYKENKYSPLNSYKTWSNDLSYEVFNKMFIEYSKGIQQARAAIYTSLGRPTTERDSVIYNFMRQLFNSKLSYFKQFDSKLVLGIENDLNLSLDITKETNLEKFKTLSTANKLYLVKSQLTNEYVENRAHLLNFFKPKLNEFSLNNNEIHKIEFKKPNTSDGIDNLVIDSFESMFYSDNVFVKTLAEDLLAYNYFTTGISFGKNSFANYIPTSIMVSDQFLNMRNELTVFKNLSDNDGLLFIRNSMNNQSITDLFIRNNWNNDIIVPKVNSRYKRDSAGARIEVVDFNGVPTGQYETVDNTPDWNLHNPSSVLSINSKQLNRESNEIRNANYLLLSKKVEGEYESVLMKKYNTESKEETTIYYYPVSKLSSSSIGKEFNNTSILEENNVPYTEDLYLDQIAHIKHGDFKSLETLLKEKEAKENGNINNC